MDIKPWRADLKRWLEQPPKIEDGSVITASRHHQVQSLDAKDGSIQWTADCSDQILDSPKLAGEDTVLIQGRTEDTGSLIGLDKTTGKERWSHSFSPRWKFSDLVLTDGPVVTRRDPLAGDDSEPMLKGLSPDTGETLWSVKAQSKSWGVPVADSNNRLFVELRGNGQESLLALDGESGETLWTRAGDGWGQPQPTENGVLIASRQGVDLVDSDSGEVKWSHQQMMSREPLQTRESIVVGGVRTDNIPGTRLTGLDPQTGKVLWNYDAPHLTGVAQGPNGQLLHHAFKLDANGQRQFYLHGLDNKTGQGLWSLELGSSEVVKVGADDHGRVTAVVKNGGKEELLVVQDGDIKWRRPVPGKGLSVVGNEEHMVLMDREGMTTVDADTGAYLDQVVTNSPLSNYDGSVSPDGQIVLSGVDGEVVSMTLAGASSIMKPSTKTPGRMRHYRYNLGETEDGHAFADVKADGIFDPSRDALLVRDRSVGHDHFTELADEAPDASRPVTPNELVNLDGDRDGYLYRGEMDDANISLWWDRDLDGELSSGDGLVAMASDGKRQAVVDLDRKKLEVRNRPVGG